MWECYQPLEHLTLLSIALPRHRELSGEGLRFLQPHLHYQLGSCTPCIALSVLGSDSSMLSPDPFLNSGVAASQGLLGRTVPPQTRTTMRPAPDPHGIHFQHVECK